MTLADKLNKYKANCDPGKDGINLVFDPETTEEAESTEFALLLENTTAYADYDPRSDDAGLVFYVTDGTETSWYYDGDCVWAETC